MTEGELWKGLADPLPPVVPGADTSWATVLNTVSVLSTDVGRLSARLDQTTRELTDQDKRFHEALANAVERLDVVEELAAQVRDLASAIADLDEDDRQGPPRPWNWSAMTDRERHESIVLLGTWVRDVLFARWPWTQRHLHWCWAYHPELLQDLSMLHVAYLQAYERSDRRFHHETDFRQALREVMGSAPEVFAHNDCPKTPARHRIPGRSRDDERHWLLAAAHDEGADNHSALDDTPSVHAEPTQGRSDGRNQILMRLHTLNEQIRDHTLPREHRDRLRSQRAELVKKNDISQQEYLRFRQKLSGPDH
jgi:hypothetical protein